MSEDIDQFLEHVEALADEYGVELHPDDVRALYSASAERGFSDTSTEEVFDEMFSETDEYADDPEDEDTDAMPEDQDDSVAQLRREVAELLASLEEREAECAKLARQTADYRQAVYKMAKDVTRDAARDAAEARKATQAAIAEAARVNADANQQREFVDAFARDPRVQRLLNKPVTP